MVNLIKPKMWKKLLFFVQMSPNTLNEIYSKSLLVKKGDYFWGQFLKWSKNWLEPKSKPPCQVELVQVGVTLGINKYWPSWSHVALLHLLPWLLQGSKCTCAILRQTICCSYKWDREKRQTRDTFTDFRETYRKQENVSNSQKHNILIAYTWRTVAYHEVRLRIGPLAKLIVTM